MLVRLRSIVKTKQKRTQEGHHKWQRWTWGTRTTCSAPLSVLGSREDWICIGPDGLGHKNGELVVAGDAPLSLLSLALEQKRTNPAAPLLQALQILCAAWNPLVGRPGFVFDCARVVLVLVGPLLAGRCLMHLGELV